MVIVDGEKYYTAKEFAEIIGIAVSDLNLKGKRWGIQREKIEGKKYWMYNEKWIEYYKDHYSAARVFRNWGDNFFTVVDNTKEEKN